MIAKYNDIREAQGEEVEDILVERSNINRGFWRQGYRFCILEERWDVLVLRRRLDIIEFYVGCEKPVSETREGGGR